MRRHVLESEITRLETQAPQLRERFGARSKEYTFCLERLQRLIHDRMRRDKRRGLYKKEAA